MNAEKAAVAGFADDRSVKIDGMGGKAGGSHTDERTASQRSDTDFKPFLPLNQKLELIYVSP